MKNYIHCTSPKFQEKINVGIEYKAFYTYNRFYHKPIFPTQMTFQGVGRETSYLNRMRARLCLLRKKSRLQITNSIPIEIYYFYIKYIYIYITKYYC